MYSLRTHLADLPLTALRGIAQNQGLVIDADTSPAFADALAAAMTDASHLHEVIRALPAGARESLRQLLATDNRLPAAVFQRRFGEIRRFGAGRLQHDRPWATPASIAETLWYHGLILRGFDETPEGLVEFFAIPRDLLPLLPAMPARPPALALSPRQPPDFSHEQGERFLEDLGTLLIFVQNRQVWLDARGQWREAALKALAGRWLTPPANADEPLAPGDRPALLLHCAQALSLLASSGRRQRLHAATLRPWLELSRPRQMETLFAAWRQARTWNDLCRTPELHCEAGNWRNDALGTRQMVLDLLQPLEPGVWYGLTDLLEAMHEQMPDFQRPDGNYDTWYIRGAGGVYLRGFEHWFEVEGRLLRYLITGPLFWLGAVALDEERERWSLTGQGAAWLRNEHLTPTNPSATPPLIVSDDFRVLVPIGAPLYDRIRLARFSEWEASWPGYRYRITQRRLRRAAAAGITTDRILDFLLRASGDAVPARVRRALLAFTP